MSSQQRTSKNLLERTSNASSSILSPKTIRRFRATLCRLSSQILIPE